MSGFNDAPPLYTAEPSLGEIIIDDKVLSENASKETETVEKVVPPDHQEILKPELLNSLYNPTDRFFWTPATSPYATAFNTPNQNIQENRLSTEKFQSDRSSTYFNYPTNQMYPQGYNLMSGYGVPMQPMVSSNGAVSQQPINVVVNANSSVNQAGNTRYCPKCRVGVIVREQSRVRQFVIMALAALTCCLCCTCCTLLKNNYVDKCSYCGKKYGHRGPRVERIKSSKRSCLGCC